MGTPLPPISKKNPPGEGQISLQQLLQLSPDVFTQQGAQALNRKISQAKQEQPALDSVIKQIAKQLNADHSSRVKDPAIMLKKIASKRLEGRAYKIDDLNDVLGNRITLNDEKQMPQAIQAVKDAASAGKFTIKKQQHIQNESHNSEHFDIQSPSGHLSELQIIPSKQELADSVVNHDIYQEYGENPPPQIAAIRDAQTDAVEDMSNGEADRLAKRVLDLHQQNRDVPLPKHITANIVANATK